MTQAAPEAFDLAIWKRCLKAEFEKELASANRRASRRPVHLSGPRNETRR